MEKEIDYLGRVVGDPERPLAAIIGGAKISSKIGVLRHLLSKVDTLLIGGGMASTFLKAQGIGVGASLVEDDKLQDAARDHRPRPRDRNVDARSADRRRGRASASPRSAVSDRRSRRACPRAG